MSDYISREAAYSLAKKICDVIDKVPRCLVGRTILDLIDEIPAADVRPVRRGKWVQVMWKYDWMVKCSRCNGVPLETSNFCPNCGADMRGESDV